MFLAHVIKVWTASGTVKSSICERIAMATLLVYMCSKMISWTDTVARPHEIFAAILF